MTYLRATGVHLPSRVMTSEETSALIGIAADYFPRVSGIHERRIADEDTTVIDMGAAAAREAMHRARLQARHIGALVVTTGTSGRAFPGPAAAIAHELGIRVSPAFDVPMASAGGIFAIWLADTLASRYGHVLAIATEKMSPVSLHEPYERSVAGLFGDGAGACVISPDAPPARPNTTTARIAATALHSEGAHANQLWLSHDGLLKMNGRSVISNATQRVSEAIREVLKATETKADEVAAFLMHQANLHVLHRIARSLHVEESRFFTNIDRYGNTSSASLLIALHEWLTDEPHKKDDKFVLAGFGAGYHWGAAMLQLE